MGTERKCGAEAPFTPAESESILIKEDLTDQDSVYCFTAEIRLSLVAVSTLIESAQSALVQVPTDSATPEFLLHS
ncbi:hypothetical protein NPIL_99891 [Nephila pilipes]|uniref:Uncharacterized protein n=1 Tax=Nephila pilipes TaxID=299642 RepID=A0A8X6TK91_NEPPI|nr:hypothetical protein NPIL_99891 [Nephila pilipes]